VLLDRAGHINVESGLGAWREGQELLERLLDVRPRAPAGLARGGFGQPARAVEAVSRPLWDDR
jgi:hypothetical protein